ncbi:tripartite tricarboxylate transporter permease [Xanthobacter tagetidis]|uniref:Tripartite tricarboxylate transporter permease n=2 Tax=Xanthobacter tagetidis TaxID=60216 RepID=A0A3L7A6J9_9HYPH|nr:tripartite tricarboxylate transporter permease [Xanthobacter tagetidis]
MDALAIGAQTALTPMNLLYCLGGVTLGTLIGVLPGLGPIATISMLLPITFYLPPETALITLAGIYYGAQYGGSTTAILVNMPGESSAVVTCLDGYAMARQGRAGPALGIAAIGSFFAGSVAILIVASSAPALASVALQFGPEDYFSLMVLGLIAAVVLASGSLLNAFSMVLVGLLVGTVGADVNSGVERYTLGIPKLIDGIDFVIMSMGLFAIAEIAVNLESAERRAVLNGKIGSIFPTWSDIRASVFPILRGTGLGSILGILPGGGAVLSSFASYALEKKIARDPSRFGKGAIEGVAGPESANNAGAQTSFIPLLTLGIPSNPVMALMIGAMMIQGVTPGPQLIKTNPDLFWGVIVSMWAGNLMLIVLNLPLIGIWIQLLKVPYRILYPAILLLCVIGVYSLSYSSVDLWLLVVFGVFGYVFVKLGCEPAPLLLGFILGPLVEEYFRRALIMSRGDLSVFITSPISGTMLVLALILVVMVVVPSIRQTRELAFRE